jgi:hypothetical protein
MKARLLQVIKLVHHRHRPTRSQQAHVGQLQTLLRLRDGALEPESPLVQHAAAQAQTRKLGGGALPEQLTLKAITRLGQVPSGFLKLLQRHLASQQGAGITLQSGLFLATQHEKQRVE